MTPRRSLDARQVERERIAQRLARPKRKRIRPRRSGRTDVEVALALIERQERYDAVVSLSLDGHSARAISEALGINERSVCRLRAKARRKGVDFSDALPGMWGGYQRRRRAPRERDG